jgi:hypothetical protein
LFRLRRGSSPQDLLLKRMHLTGCYLKRSDQRFRWSEAGLWAWLDLNQRPHPYQVSRAQRCADRRFPRSPVSVRGEGMRSNSPPGLAHRRNAVAAGNLCHQPVADKAMGLPGGRGSAIGRVIPAW